MQTVSGSSRPVDRVVRVAAVLLAMMAVAAVALAVSALATAHRSPFRHAAEVTDSERSLISTFYGSKIGLASAAGQPDALPGTITAVRPDLGDAVFADFFDGARETPGTVLRDATISAEVLDLARASDGSTIFRVRTAMSVLAQPPHSAADDSGMTVDHQLVARMNTSGDAIRLLDDSVLPDPPGFPEPPAALLGALPAAIVVALTTVAVLIPLSALGRARRRGKLIGLAVAAAVLGLTALASLSLSVSVVGSDGPGRADCVMSVDDWSTTSDPRAGDEFWSSCLATSRLSLAALVIGVAGTVPAAVLITRRLNRNRP